MNLEAKRRKRKALKRKLAAPLVDETLPILQDLLSNGYSTVTWKTFPGACVLCRRLNRHKWKLKDFINNLRHSAPLFEHGHVNDRCEIEVTGPGKEKIILNYSGLV